MIAIPLSQKDSTKLNEDFSSAPFFALMDTLSGNFRIVENKDNVLDLFKENNIDSIVAYEKEDVLQTIAQSDIDVFSAYKNSLTLEEIYTKAVNNKLTKMY